MIHSQNQKVVNLIKPQSFGTSATVSGTVSVVGWDYALVVLKLDTSSSTDSVVRLSEGDGTSFATASDLAMTTAATDTSNQAYYGWLLSLKTRKKNLKLEYQPQGAARIGSADVYLSRGETAPITAAGRGLSQQVIV